MRYVHFTLFTYQRKLQFISGPHHNICALKAGYQNANANVKHDNSSNDSDRHCRNGSHCTDRKRTRVYTPVRSEPINSKSAEETKVESGDSHVDSIERRARDRQNMSEIRKRDAFTRRTAVRINIPSFKVAQYPRLSHLLVSSILDLRRCKSASLWPSSMARYSWHNSIIICEWKIRTQYGELCGYRICIFFDRRNRSFLVL